MKRMVVLFFMGIFIISLVSCSLPGASSEPTDAPPPPPEPTDPPPPATDTPEPTPTTDPYIGVVHTLMPGEPVLTYWAYDCNTGRYTEASTNPVIGGGCNLWEQNFIERPVNADMSLYYPHLDIVRFQMGREEPWIYADLQTFSDGASTEMNGSYGLELDFDVDGDGDLLVMVSDPSAYPAGEWHAMGVQVWQDANDDIGGDTPILADSENPGDGYETLLFDQGLGDDPDLAWARIAPDEAFTVDFAFKTSVVPEGVGAFLWWTWASQEPLDPAAFDYVDTFDEDEVYQIGNSCRWIFEGPPQPVPNICPYEAPQPEKEPGERTAYCFVRQIVFTHVVPWTCQVCPSPCPAGYECGGSCGP